MSIYKLNLYHCCRNWLRSSTWHVTGFLLTSLMFGSLVVLWPIGANTTANIREITLVARDMAFYRDGIDSPNPVLMMQSGELVRIVLWNEDVGIAHNFEIDAWNQRILSPQLDHSASVLIEVPNRPGRYVYVCGPHSLLMRGIIEVVAAD